VKEITITAERPPAEPSGNVTFGVRIPKHVARRVRLSIPPGESGKRELGAYVAQLLTEAMDARDVPQDL
jgi:hypothetical protein